MEKKYSISEALTVVLLPDGNTSDLEVDESKHDIENVLFVYNNIKCKTRNKG